MNKKVFLENYLNKLSSKIIPDQSTIQKILKIKDVLLKSARQKSKVIIVGNGGSAAIAGHASIDFTKNTKIRMVNFNESSLLTCFGNDYGYEKWTEKAIDFYADKKDVLILISSSGTSKNLLNASKAARKMKVSKIITFTGNKKNNPLSKRGDINLWVNSDIYNYIENIHQIWLLSIADLISLNKVK